MKDVKDIIMDPKAIEVFKRPIPKELIKQRDGGGGKQLDYIGGETAIELLNEAFGYVWCDEVVSKEIVACVPKPMYTGWGKERKPVLNADGTQKMEEQPPYVEVRVRLTHLPTGVYHEGFGTKILLGGASEQEGCSKAAHTDALKKAATKFGVGLELYMDKESDAPASKAPQSGGYKKDYPAKSAQAPAAPPKTESNPWAGKEGEIRKLKELKAILGIDDNDKLNPFVAEFTGSKGDTYEKVSPGNITAFNKFLEKKAANA